MRYVLNFLAILALALLASVPALAQTAVVPAPTASRAASSVMYERALGNQKALIGRLQAQVDQYKTLCCVQPGCASVPNTPQCTNLKSSVTRISGRTDWNRDQRAEILEILRGVMPKLTAEFTVLHQEHRKILDGQARILDEMKKMMRRGGICEDALAYLDTSDIDGSTKTKIVDAFGLVYKECKMAQVVDGTRVLIHAASLGAGITKFGNNYIIEQNEKVNDSLATVATWVVPTALTMTGAFAINHWAIGDGATHTTILADGSQIVEHEDNDASKMMVYGTSVLVGLAVSALIEDW